MSARRRSVVIPEQRRGRAVEVLRRRARRRLSPAGALALVSAAAEALEHGHLGAARDLLEIVVRPAVAEQILDDLLADDPAAAREAS